MFIKQQLCAGLSVLEAVCITSFNQGGQYLWNDSKNKVKSIYVWYDFYFQSHWGSIFNNLITQHLLI